ncbi:hypothetical protein Tco_1020154 [Tanacetum coccineum]|uniref:Uncharacterized protein n=1 Tax=Tanacetum coccineum TaxID=301880 RepID=A0ABQ5G0V7_9ASTR
MRAVCTIHGFGIALDEPTPVVAEPEADSLAIEELRSLQNDTAKDKEQEAEKPLGMQFAFLHINVFAVLPRRLPPDINVDHKPGSAVRQALPPDSRMSCSSQVS